MLTPIGPMYIYIYIYTSTHSIYAYECRRAPVPPWHDNVITLSNQVRWSVGLSLSTSSYLTLRTTLQLWAHFKFGVYEHQPAGMQTPEFVASGVFGIANIHIHISAYGLNVGIIGEPAIKDPGTRELRILQNALKTHKVPGAMDDAWMDLMLSPWVSGKDALLLAGHPCNDGEDFVFAWRTGTSADLKSKAFQPENCLLGDNVSPEGSTVRMNGALATSKNTWACTLRCGISWP